jgi:uncharacterized iron-regulated protein
MAGSALEVLARPVWLMAAMLAPALASSHPLIDRIWLPAEERYTEQSALFATLGEYRFVLVGENHGHPDHHGIQASIVAALASQGREPVVAMEMLDMEQNAALDRVQQHPAVSPDDIAAAVDWESSGWPGWELYEPIVAAALENGLRIVAANLPLDQVRAVAREGLDHLPEEKIRALGLDQPLAPAAEAMLRQRLDSAHCGSMPEEALDAMLAAQRLRDAFMAARLMSEAPPDGAVLIAGSGHLGISSGVPVYLARARETSLYTVALVPVIDGRTSPQNYGGDFDALWFTVPHPSPPPDPCAGISASESGPR